MIEILEEAYVKMQDKGGSSSKLSVLDKLIITLRGYYRKYFSKKGEYFMGKVVFILLLLLVLVTGCSDTSSEKGGKYNQNDHLWIFCTLLADGRKFQYKLDKEDGLDEYGNYVEGVGWYIENSIIKYDSAEDAKRSIENNSYYPSKCTLSPR